MLGFHLCSRLTKDHSRDRAIRLKYTQTSFSFLDDVFLSRVSFFSGSTSHRCRGLGDHWKRCSGPGVWPTPRDERANERRVLLFCPARGGNRAGGKCRAQCRGPAFTRCRTRRISTNYLRWRAVLVFSVGLRTATVRTSWFVSIARRPKGERYC